MKLFLLCALLAASLPGSATAGPTWKEAIQQYRDAFANSAGQPKPTVYPELVGRIDGLFLRYPMTHIVLHGVTEEGKKSTTDLYISEKEVCIFEPDVGWNLYADADHVFEWETGHKTGIKTARDNPKLVAYLYYLTDVSWIIAGIYSEYLAKPDQFNRVAHKGEKWTELALKTPIEGFEAIYCSEKPLWFYGLRHKDPETGKASEMTISGPAPAKEIPAKIKKLMTTIHFEDSNQSLDRHMGFL